MKYKCNVCERVFDQKSHYDNHLHRKYGCQPKNDDILDLKNENKIETSKHVSKAFPSVSKRFQSVSCNYECSICHIKYETRAGFYKHKIKSHQNYEDELKKLSDDTTVNNIITKEDYDNLKLDLVKMKQIINSSIVKPNRSTKNVLLSNSNNTNITVNNNKQEIIQAQSNKPVRLIDFGKEDFSKLSTSEVKEILMSSSESYLLVFKYLHQNNRLLEYQNIFINNLRSNDIYYVADGVFMIRNQKLAIQDIINQLADCVEYLKNLNKDNMSSVIFELMEDRYKMFKDFDINEIHDKETKQKYTELCQRLRHMLYENRMLVRSLPLLEMDTKKIELLEL
jgi:rubredoxin